MCIDFSKMSDREVVKRALEGEPLAYSTLIERHRAGVISHISEQLSVTVGQGDEKAEEPQDICQEAFHRAFSHLKEYNPKYEFSTWLYTIAKNITIDYSRRQLNTLAAGIVGSDKQEVQQVESGGMSSSPEDKMISSQEYALLISHIENLPERYKEIAIMRFINEYAYQEIAQKLNMPINSVKTILRRAKKLLSNIIEQ